MAAARTGGKERCYRGWAPETAQARRAGGQALSGVHCCYSLFVNENEQRQISYSIITRLHLFFKVLLQRHPEPNTIIMMPGRLAGSLAVVPLYSSFNISFYHFILLFFCVYILLYISHVYWNMQVTFFFILLFLWILVLTKEHILFFDTLDFPYGRRLQAVFSRYRFVIIEGTTM